MKHPELIQALTLKQKVALLSGRDIWSTYPIPQQNIPAMYLSDGPHGVRKQLGASDHLGLNASQPATCFPTAAGVANSWNPDLAQEIGRTIGKEAACQQVNVLLGPGLNTKRNPLGGRSFEYYSEDPYLSGKMAAALIRGIQENGISACPKHFAANSQELLRMASDSVVDMRALRELYLTNFEIAVKEGHPKSIMSSYNRINGTYANDDAWLLTDVLRKEWGFDGFVVTDWGGSNDHAQAVRAGGNLEMPGTGGDSDREIFAALEAGTLTEDEVDQRVDQLLDVVLSTHAATADGPKEFDVEAHHALARKAAAETAVLLKNEEDILPLAPGTRVAVLGDMALEPRYQGAGSSVVNPTKLDKPIDCLRACDLEITGQAQGYRRDGKDDQALLDSAVSAAKNADVVLLYLGLPEISESEGMDRQHMRLPANQEKLLYAVAEANPNLVVVLSGGSAVELPWVDQCKGLIHGYLSGQAGAGAMADLLTGAVNPSGKLAEGFPIRYEDTPNHTYFPGRQRTAEYRESIYVGYRYYETVGKAVRFPFGFGLSYTTFAYSDLKATQNEVSFTLTNTGKCAGGEIAQVYLSAVNSGIFRPARELKGFAKVFLEPGESRTVTIPLDDKAFRYFNVKTNAWEVEGGEYRVQVGASAPTSASPLPWRWRAPVLPSPTTGRSCPATTPPRSRPSPTTSLPPCWAVPIPQDKWDRSQPLGYNDSLSQMIYAKGFVARFAAGRLAAIQRKSEEKDQPNLNVLFIHSMPFRGLAKMSNGLVTTEMTASILEACNGHFFRGMGKTIAGFFANGKVKKERSKTL